MNPQYELYQLIDRYLSHQLSQEELELFEAKLAVDENLRETLEAQQMAHDLILDNEMIKLKDRMRSEMSGGTSGFSSGTKIIISSLAVITLGTLTYFYTTRDTVSSSVDPAPVEKISPEINTKNTLVTSSEKNKTKISLQEELASNPDFTQTVSEPTEKESFNKETNIIPTTENKEVSNKNIPVALVPVLEKKVVNCNDLPIQGNARVDYGLNNTEAMIVIDKNSVTGGTPPYSYSLDKENYTASNRFEDLKEGSYYVYIRDHVHCIAKLEKPLVIKHKTKEIDDTFTPAQGERWSFPLNGNSNAEITIQNKAGVVVYSTKINNGYPYDWDGRDKNGSELESGIYFFIVTFTDNEMVKGHISIFR